MSDSALTRLTISWTKETDLALRTYLEVRGMKKGDLSKFIEDAVRWRLFEETVATIRDRNVDTAPEALEGLIEASIRDARRARAERRQFPASH